MGKIIRNKKNDTVQFVLIIILLFCVLFPLLKMGSMTSFTAIVSLFQTDKFKTALFNSVVVTLVASSFSIFIAFGLAWSISRTNINYKSVFSILLVFPMLIPSISHGTGLIILFGSNGIVTNFFNISASIYGFWGIIIGAILYSYPVAFLMFNSILSYEDGTPYEAAEVLGINRFKQFFAITIPYLRKPLISIFFAVFTMIFTDYGIPLSVGGKFITLPTILYQEVIGQLNFSKGSAIGFVLLIPALIAFIFDSTNKDKGNQNFVTKTVEYQISKYRNFAGYCICSLISIFVLFVNVSFIFLAFAEKYPNNMNFSLVNFQKTFQLSGGRYLLNSIFISLFVTFIGTIVAFLLAYFASRIRNKKSKFLHLFTLSTLAIPGIVLGLSYSLAFSNTIIYGTLFILILVNITHFINSPYLLMYNSFSKINENLEAVGATLGISSIMMVKDVLIPQVKFTLLEMATYFFTNSMVTISAVSFLATTATKPFSLMINQFDALMIIECSAVVSVVILIVNIVLKVAIYYIKKILKGEKYANI